MSGAHAAILSIAENADIFSSNITFNDDAFDPDDAVASVSYSLINDGSVAESRGGSGTFYRWLYSGYASNFDVIATKVSGDNPDEGVLNTWQNLGTSRTWNLISIAIGSGSSQLKSCTLTITIAKADNHSAVLGTATIYLEALAQVF